MKKILISILIVGLLVLAFVGMYKGIEIGSFTISNIENLKGQNLKLNQDLEEANELSNKTYNVAVDDLEGAIKQLKISKEEYENKKIYSKAEESLGTIEVKTYTLHYLWTILGNYRKDRGVKSLNLNLKSTVNKDVYDLDFTLIGKYTSITDFLYDIEDDRELNFEIEDFKLTSDIAKEEEVVKKETKTGNEIWSSVLPQQNVGYLKQDKPESDLVNTTEKTATKTNKTTSQEKEQKNKTEHNDKSGKNTSIIVEGNNDGTILKATFTVKNVGITKE